jgi:hypothetical protein
MAIPLVLLSRHGFVGGFLRNVYKGCMLPDHVSRDPKIPTLIFRPADLDIVV